MLKKKLIFNFFFFLKKKKIFSQKFLFKAYYLQIKYDFHNRRKNRENCKFDKKKKKFYNLLIFWEYYLKNAQRATPCRFPKKNNRNDIPAKITQTFGSPDTPIISRPKIS